MIHFFVIGWTITSPFFLRLNILGSKENYQKNEISNLMQTMVLVVFSCNLMLFKYYRSKKPRFANGEVIDYDIYDLTQGEKI